MTEEQFKINDLVEVPMWVTTMRRDWIIMDIVSNSGEAIIKHLFRNEQTVIELSKLKYQTKEDK